MVGAEDAEDALAPPGVVQGGGEGGLGPPEPELPGEPDEQGRAGELERGGGAGDGGDPAGLKLPHRVPDPLVQAIVGGGEGAQHVEERLRELVAAHGEPDLDDPNARSTPGPRDR